MIQMRLLLSFCSLCLCTGFLAGCGSSDSAPATASNQTDASVSEEVKTAEISLPTASINAAPKKPVADTAASILEQISEVMRQPLATQRGPGTQTGCPPD
ncbi:MAG: hypothetical protein R3C11_28690 [Planctomycetaceae bacterium]